jgi:hypothetical protein
MTVKSAEQLKNRNATTDKSFGNVTQPQSDVSEGCDGQSPIEDHRTSASTSTNAPKIPENQAESAMILKAANAGFETITRIDSIMSQATAKVAAASEQLAIQAADQDAFVLGGGHYLTTYFNHLKMGEFETTFSGQMNFYVSVVNHTVRTEGERRMDRQRPWTRRWPFG